MISVIIPTYNRGNCLERSVRSVLEQTYTDIELIIVDDCSTDDTESVVRNLDDKRIRYIKHETNKGACVARNTGILASYGEFIAFQDSDDSWRPDKLQLQIDKMLKDDADICYCNCVRHGLSDKSSVMYPDLEEGIVEYETFISKAHASTQLLLVKREVCENCLFDPQIKRFQDYDWCIRAGQNHKVVFINEVLVDVYLQEDSISCMGTQKSINAYRVLLDKYSDVCQKHPSFYIENMNAIGDLRAAIGDRAGDEFQKLYQVSRNRKYILKNMLYKTGILGFYYGRKK